MIIYVTACLGGLLLASLLTPQVVRLGRVLGLVDVPGVRRIHARPIPRIGGLAVAVATALATLSALWVHGLADGKLPVGGEKLAWLAAGAAVIFLLGLLDDLRNLRPMTKLLGQTLAAVMVVAGGGIIDSVTIGQHAVRLGVLGLPITLVWIVGITNAVNMIDGLDGLAAGIAAMACAVLAIFAVHTGQPIMAMLMLALLGSLLGFLLFNFNPAKVFLGDGGSLFIGFVLSSGSVLSAMKAPTLAALSLTVLTLALPIMDMVLSMMRRMLERRSIFSADRNHIHHRLLGRGLTHRSAVLFIYLVTFGVACASLWMMLLRDREALLVLVLAVAGVLAVFRGLGAVRLRDSWSKLLAELACARQARQQQHCFESAQLRMREAQTPADWWDAMCDAADKMGFLWMRCRVRDSAGAKFTSTWRRKRVCQVVTRIVRGTIPTNLPAPIKGICRIDVAVAVNGHLEDAGRRMTLFARLIDENNAMLRLPAVRQARTSPVAKVDHPLRPQATKLRRLVTQNAEPGHA